MPTLRIFSPIYGPGFPDRYGALALPSLMQAGNVPALIAAGWDVRVSVYTDISSYADVADHVRPWAELIDIRTAPLDRGGVLVGAMHRVWQNECLLNEMRECIKIGAHLTLCGAGAVYGNGSLFNLAVMAHETECAAACIYLRTAEGPFRLAMSDCPIVNDVIENDLLAAIAIETLHPVSRSDFGAETSRCHMWGHALKQLSPRLFAVRFQIPSVFCVRPTLGDVAYFNLKGDFRVWDSGWTDYLIARRRFAFLASSDLAFIAECTRDGKANMEHHAAADALLGPMIDRREYQGSDRNRTAIGQIRTIRDVTFR